MLGLVYLGEIYRLYYSNRAIVVKLKRHSNAHEFSLCRCALSHDGKGSGTRFCCSEAWHYSRSCLSQVTVYGRVPAFLQKDGAP